MSRTTTVTGWCSAVGGLAWTAACLVHNSQPAGCIDEGCVGHAMRNSSAADSALFAIAGVLLAASCAGLLVLARAVRPLGRVGAAAAVAGGLGLALLAGAEVMSVVDGNWGGMPGLVVPGVLALVVGLVLVAAVVLRSRVLPPALSALVLATALLLPFANEQTSRVLLAVPFGLVWLATGAFLVAGAASRRAARAA